MPPLSCKETRFQSAFELYDAPSPLFAEYQYEQNKKLRHQSMLATLRSARPIKRFSGGRQSKSVDLLSNGAVRKRFDGSPKHLQKMRIEIVNLQKLAARACDFVPRLLAVDEGQRTIYLTYCGSRPANYTDDLRKQVQSKVALLRTKYGLQRSFKRSGMPRLANVAIDKGGRVHLIDFGPPWHST